MGQSLTLFATVEVLVPGAGTPTGTVAFKDTGATITGCSARPIGSGGTATCTTSVLASGPQSITAQYSGDANLIASVSGLLETVNRAIPTVSLTASQPGGAGTPVQFVVTVTGVGAITPTGTVDITTQSAPATTIVPCALSGSGNTASCTVSATVGLGTTTFLAKYLGDTNYLAVTGTSASINVLSVRARAR